MKNAVWVLATGAALLAGCSGDKSYESSAPAPISDVAMERMEMGGAPMKVSADGAQPTAPPTETSSNPVSQSFLAYRYTYGFSLPAKAVAGTAKSHAQICLDAGPAKCQLLSSNTNARSADYVNAYVNLRAEPNWLKRFTADIQSSIEAAKGEMTESGVTAQDLTRSILDTDARLKAQKALRTRLEGLLETRNAELPDLLSLERELARVQGEIESATSTLNVLRKRVSMSEVNINYQSQQVAISGSTMGPIARSMKNFFGTVAYSLSLVIDFIAAILPWLILVIPGLWLLRRWWRRRKAK